MNKNTWIVIGVLAFIFIVGGAYTSMNNKDDSIMETETTDSFEIQNTDDEMMKNEIENMENKDDMVKENQVDMMDKDIVQETMMKGSYESYAPEKIARAETGDVVLFFHASWCPSCRGLHSNIEKNVDGIPDGVTILKVNYDTETALKEKYGVTYQHTLVQVDMDGNLIKKWSGGSKLTNLLSEIK